MIHSTCYAGGPAKSPGTQTARTPLRRHFEPSHTLVLRLSFALAPANSFASPTSKKITRKFFVSPTYAKTGGGDIFCKMSSRLTLLFSLAVLTTKLSTIVGSPTFPFLHSFRRSLGRHASSAISKHELFRKPKSTDRNVCAARRRNPRPRPIRRAWGTRLAGHGALF